MKPKLRLIVPFLALVLLPLSFSGCATGDLLGNFNLISPAEEQQLGQQIAAQIARDNAIVADPQVTGYINSIGQRLVDASMKPSAGYQFYVIEDESVNAFAIPGNHLYVQTGLIMAAETENELAAVMAHELAHAEQRHPTERLSRQMGAEMIAGMLLGRDSGAGVQQAAGMLVAGGISAYSRSAELQADEIAVYLMNRAGYDPRGLTSFFEKLVALEQQAGGGGRSLFATHPPTPERIRAATQMIESFGAARSANTALVGGLDAVKARVSSL